MQHIVDKLDYRTVAYTTGDELYDLALKSEKLQTALSQLMSGNCFESLECFTELQSLDYLTQSLVALSELWLGLAKQTPQDWNDEAYDLARKVKLKALADKLCGQQERAALTENLETGFCDLF